MSNMYPASPTNSGYNYPGTPQNNQYQAQQSNSHYPGGVYSANSQFSGNIQNNQYQSTPNNVMHPNQYPGNPYQGSPNSQYSGNSQNNQYPGGYNYQAASGNIHYQGGTPTGPTGYSYQSPPSSYNAVGNQAENERFYQNLCVYRSQDGFNKKQQMLPPDDR